MFFPRRLVRLQYSAVTLLGFWCLERGSREYKTQDDLAVKEAPNASANPILAQCLTIVVLGSKMLKI